VPEEGPRLDPWLLKPLQHFPRKSFNHHTPNSTKGPHIQETSVHNVVRKKIERFPDPDYAFSRRPWLWDAGFICENCHGSHQCWRDIPMGPSISWCDILRIFSLGLYKIKSLKVCSSWHWWVASITDRILVNTWRDIKARLEKLWDNGGVHVEAYWWFLHNRVTLYYYHY